tara:strand:- start:191 stop:430 length:240 start_codon:yes stop_codon:yes gene_type:complete
VFDVNEKPLLEEELEFIEFIEFMEFIDAFGCGVALTFPKDGFLVELNPCVLLLLKDTLVVRFGVSLLAMLYCFFNWLTC